MKKQVIVVGLGRFGSSVAETLFNLGYDVLAVDKDEARIQSIATRVTHAVQGDATSEAVLKELGIEKFDVAIVAVGTDIQSSVLSTILLKRLGVPYIIARAENELHGSILEKIGADKVVYPEREMGSRVVHVLTLKDVVDYIPVLQRYGVAKLVAPPYFAGMTLSDAGFGRKGKWGVVALLVQHGNELVVAPSDTEIMREGDILVVIGSDDKLEGLLTEHGRGQTGE